MEDTAEGQDFQALFALMKFLALTRTLFRQTFFRESSTDRSERKSRPKRSREKHHSARDLLRLETCSRWPKLFGALAAAQAALTRILFVAALRRRKGKHWPIMEMLKCSKKLFTVQHSVFQKARFQREFFTLSRCKREAHYKGSNHCNEGFVMLFT